MHKAIQQAVNGAAKKGVAVTVKTKIKAKPMSKAMSGGGGR